MPDPLEQLRTPVDTVEPRAGFRDALRRRIVDALGTDAVGDPLAPTPRTPEVPVSAITPYLTADDASAAIDFYVAAFGAVEDFRVVADDGRIGHAELRIGDARIQLSDEYPEIDVRSPRSLGGTAAAFSLTVSDCDALFARAVAAGATEVRQPEDQTHGNRMAVVRDPFGHRWNLLQPTEVFDVEAYAARMVGSDFGVVVGPGGRTSHRTSPDGLWPGLAYRDAPAGIRFAVDVLGFETRIVVPDERDPDVVVHSELRWPEGGIVQIATARESMYARSPGTGVLYVVTLDPESVLARCEAAGAEIVAPMVEVDYGVPGDRNFTVRDTEGNLWCFGTYGADR